MTILLDKRSPAMTSDSDDTPTAAPRARNTEVAFRVRGWVSEAPPGLEFTSANVAASTSCHTTSVNGVLEKLVREGILDQPRKNGRHKIYLKRSRRRPHLAVNNPHDEAIFAPTEKLFVLLAESLPDDVLLRELARRLTK